MLVNLLVKRNFFKQIFIIVLFLLLGATNFNSFDLNDLEKIGLSIFLLTVIFVAYTDYSNDLISTSSYPSFFYSLWIMPFIASMVDFRLSGSLLLITYSSLKLFYFESEKNNPFNAVDIGIFMSFAILLYPPLLFLGVVVFAYFLTLRAVEPKVPILALLGFIVPILIIIQISYLLDYYFLLNFYKEQLTPKIIHFNLKQVFLIPIGAILIFYFTNHLKNVNKLSAQKKRVFLLIHLMFVTILAIFILYGGKTDNFLAFLGISITIMLTRYFKESKPAIEWLNEAFLWVFMVCLLIYNFYDRIPRFFSLITEVSF